MDQVLSDLKGLVESVTKSSEQIRWKASTFKE